MKSYVIIGLGLFGTQLALDLYEQGENVLVIDKNEELINEYANRVSRAIIADAKKREVLKQLGVDKCDCAIVAMTSDLATSVLITMNLRALGIKEIICKAQNETDKEVLETLGASKVIIPEKIAADRLCRRISQPNVLEYIELSDEHGIIELEPPESWIGKSITGLNIRVKYSVNIIAIKRNGKIIVSFDPKEPIEKEDVFVLIGNNKSLNKIQGVR